MTKDRNPELESGRYVVSAPDPEFLVVADETSEVLVIHSESDAVVELVSVIRKAGGLVTVYVSTEL